ncbi:MAG: zinc-dependent metalloprotease [Flavitalea sp.]
MSRLLLFIFLVPSLVFSQKISTIEEKTSGLKKYPGFFNFYWDENTGKIWLEIDKTDTEILYNSSLPAGLGSNDIGLDRGKLGNSMVVKFSRTGRKLMLIQPNYDYRAVNGDGPEKKAVEQSFAQSIMWGFTIEAESNGRLLVDATDFLVRDAVGAGSTIKRMRQGSYSFDKTRSSIYLPQTKNFPFNTEIESTITLTGGDDAGRFVRSVTPSAEAITLRVHHSFVQLPDNNYRPRVFDARSGFIPTSYYDYSTPVTEPINKQFIIRHRLQKKNASGEVVKPIVYYIDNGTPEPIRSALFDGAKWWNQAFEAAGFKNGFQVQILPDTADPMDIRYNMVNWVHRSTRGWSYGAAVVDPRTGEIIKGNVTLGSLRVRQDYLIASGLLAPFANGVPADNKMLQMAVARLRQLSAHEIGHTLGLMHNYAASVTNRASVMDYPHPTVKLDQKGEITLADAYDDKIGDWDKAAITWGYGDFGSGAEETSQLNKVLTDAAGKGLQFISDRDARAPGGLHPQAHLWDNGADAVTELNDVMKIRSKALAQFGINNIRTGVPMAMLEEALVPVYLFHRYQVEAATKLVGGMNYTYALRGDGQTPLKPLNRTEQLRALNAVIDCFDPAKLELPKSILSLIPPRPAGAENSAELFSKRTGLAFDAMSPAETAVDLPLSFLFTNDRLTRLVQYEAISEGLSLRDMLSTLIDRTWKTPRKTGMQKLIQFQTEQVLLTYLLAASTSEESSFQARATVLQKTKELKSYIEQQLKTATDNSYAAHLQLALERMKSPDKAKPSVHSTIPPGAPIGCEDEYPLTFSER